MQHGLLKLAPIHLAEVPLGPEHVELVAVFRHVLLFVVLVVLVRFKVVLFAVLPAHCTGASVERKVRKVRGVVQHVFLLVQVAFIVGGVATVLVP
jgi:hypothetical protein